MSKGLILPSSISSPQDLTALILEMKEYARWFAHEAIKAKVSAKRSSGGPELSPAAAEIVRMLGTAPTRAAIDDTVRTLEDYHTSASVITITLAAPPTAGIKKSLVTWCRENLRPDIMVNFQFNKTILGGMVIRAGSRVYDWSLRKDILDNRAVFPKVLRRV